MWNIGRLDYGELSNISAKDVKGENFAKRTEKCKILGIFLDKELGNLEDHGCPKVEVLVDKKLGLLEVPYQTQDHTSLCRAKGKNFGCMDYAAFRVANFVLCLVLSLYIQEKSSSYSIFFKFHFEKLILGNR